MNIFKILNLHSIKFYFLLIFAIFFIQSCSTFYYRTYPEESKEEDPEPDYTITLDPKFQEYVSFMFIGNRIENFGTYFNTFFNAEDNYNDAYDDYTTKLLSNYSERLDSIYISPNLSQESLDKFNQAIQKASRVIQYHKSSAFMDKAVLLVGKSYFYMGDYIKAERKFSEFISKLSNSSLIDEAVLFLARTQLRLNNTATALDRLNYIIEHSRDKDIVAQSYQAIAEYYVHTKDYESSVNFYRKSIEFSSDKSFKAQMQFLVASIIAKKVPKEGAVEFNKVLDYPVTYDLEYLTRYNYAKNLILSNDFTDADPLLNKLEVKYKDSPDYLAEISFLRAKYFDQKGDHKNAIDRYIYVIQNYPKTVSSSDASFALANYYENMVGDYLTAYRYYKFSTEESSAGHNYADAINKLKIFRKYFDLRSAIAGTKINTDYDSVFINQTHAVNKEGEGDQIKKGDEGNQGNQGEQHKQQGKGGGFSNKRLLNSVILFDSSTGDLNGPVGNPKFKKLQDTLNTIKKDTLKDTLKVNKTENIDSTKIKQDLAINAKFELAELFLYDLNKPDSAEHHLKDVYEQSEDYEFKSKVLFTLASLYRNSNKTTLADETLNKIVKDYPNSSIANECRRLLNLPLVDVVTTDPADSLYFNAENEFSSGMYEQSLNAFKQIMTDFPGSKHFNRAVYAIGWIYENILNQHDSAFSYYSKVVKSDPNSDYSKLVAAKVSEFEGYKAGKIDSTGKEIIDSSSIKTDSLNHLDTLKQADTLGAKQDLKNAPPELGPDQNGNIQGDPSKQGPDMNKEEKKEKDPTK
jgi:TolA-binding protein